MFITRSVRRQNKKCFVTTPFKDVFSFCAPDSGCVKFDSDSGQNLVMMKPNLSNEFMTQHISDNYLIVVSGRKC